ncbi:MAG: AraC family transcriptional regulator, partial [Blautia sp.]|nr:AraC family transcriptional regulator [Blautia sp.]
YYDVCHTFLLPDRKQIAAICNHEHFSVKSTGLKRELAELGTSPDFYIGISISSNSYKSLYNLYSNAVQRIFYEKSFGKDSDLTGFSLLTYQDCVRIFTEKDPKKAQELLREYIQNSCSVSPEGLPAESIFSSFFHNISLYLESLELTLPEERQPVYSGANDLAWLTDEIFQALSAVKKALQQTSDHQNSGNGTQIQQLLEYIRKNYQHDISLDDLADSVKMHPNYVCTLFKKHIGQSYLFCLHQERLRSAKQLLIDTDLTIDEIARQVGYNSASQLARIFRKYESTSPSDFRSKH